MNIVIHRFYLDLLIKASLLYALLLILLSGLHIFAPARGGMLAVTQIFAPYLFLPLLLALPLALLNGTGLLKLTFMTCIIIFCARFGPGLISVPPTPTSNAVQVEVASWNLYFGNRKPEAITQLLNSIPADIVALQELTYVHVQLIASDKGLQRRFPYRIFLPHRSAQGIGLLSAYPILDRGMHTNPSALWAHLDLGNGRTLVVVNVNLLAPHFSMLHTLPLPYRFDTSTRDAAIMQVRKFIAPFLQQGAPLLVMGDFNVTQREPAYHDLTAGLQDAHYRVGLGSGNTWRPSRRWGFGLLRIDYLLSSSAVIPLRTTVDCTPRGSDHCILSGIFELP